MAGLKTMLHAVLVHMLPSDCTKAALDLLPKKHFEKYKHDEVGLKVYFRNYSSARESILQRTVQIQGTSYAICPLETNLTLHDIRKYASKPTIKDLMAPFGPVIDLYPVQVNNFKTTELTNDYRIILGVPELRVDFTLASLQLPDLKDHSFRVSFFCRLCRCDGHMQYECSEYTHCSSQQTQSLPDHCHPEHQRTCPEAGCSTVSMNRIRFPSYEQYEEQVPKEETEVEMDTVKIKEEHVNPDHGSCVRFECNQAEIMMNTHSADYFTFESPNKDCKENNLQHEHATQISELNMKVEDTFKQSPVIGAIQGTSQMHFDDDSAIQTSISAVTPKKKKGRKEFGQEEKKTSHKRKSSKCCKLSKLSDGYMWSHLIPPDDNLKCTKKLLFTIINTHHVDITEKEEWKLHKILEWNRSRDKKFLKVKEKKFIKWLELYLEKVSRERMLNVNSGGEKWAFQTQDVAGEQISGGVEKKVNSKQQTSVRLSPGIESIVLKTSGVLAPNLLRSFLNQVRGRRRPLEIAREYFTTDIVSLFNQLKEVEKSYFLHGERGRREDRDIDFIKRLGQRLMQNYDVRICSQQSEFKKLPSHKKSLSKIYKSDKQEIVKFGSQNKELKSSFPCHVKSGEYPAEFMKCNLEKPFVKGGKPSRTSISSESCNAKYPEKNIQLNLQRNLSYDEQYLSSWKHSNTEELGKFETDYSFYNSQCSSNLSYSTDNGSLQNSHLIVQRTLPDKIPSNASQSSADNDSRQSSIVEEFPMITKENLQQILSYVRQSSENVLFETEPELLPSIKTEVKNE